MKKIACIRFWFEGNSFSPRPTRQSDFASREWFTGEDALRFYDGKAVELAAVAAYQQQQRASFDVLLSAAAYPAGPMQYGLFASMLQCIEGRLQGQHYDGVYCSLHGAAVCDEYAHPEKELLQLLRQRVGNIPLAASFDLHANLDSDIGELVDIVVGYKTYPHTDMVECAEKTLDLLLATIDGAIRPTTRIYPAGFAPTSFNMATADGPMAAMVGAARELERSTACHDITIFGGFVYADTAHTQASISICSDHNPRVTADTAACLLRKYRRLEPAFAAHLPAAKECVDAIVQKRMKLPIAVLEPADNIFSGGAGDTPGLLREALRISGRYRSVFAFMHDPENIARAHRLGTGAQATFQLGARYGTHFGQPVKLTATVARIGDDQFVNEGPMETGLPVSLGATAVLAHGQLSIVLTSKLVPVNDPAYFTCLGVDLHAVDLLFVKAKNHFRAAFSDCFEAIVEAATPGPAAADLSSLPFQYSSQRLS